MSTALFIRMQDREGGCTTCSRPADYCGVPMYEGYVLPNDWPGEWGGFPCCWRCFEVQQTLTKPMPPRAFRLLVATWFS